MSKCLGEKQHGCLGKFRDLAIVNSSLSPSLRLIGIQDKSSTHSHRVLMSFRAFAIFPILLLLGCGSSSLDAIPVTGTVTYRGQPLIGGTVSFHPAGGGQGRPANARINPDGSFAAFTLQSSPGLTPGEYNVSVLYLERPLTEAAPSASKIQIPPHYSSPETSGLTLRVSSGDDPIIFNIPLAD